MIEVLFIIIKLSAFIILPTLFVAAYYKKLDVLTILTSAMIIGALSMIGIMIIDILDHL